MRDLEGEDFSSPSFFIFPAELVFYAIWFYAEINLICLEEIYDGCIG